ncbi:MAG: MerR family DNA-binding transcriptional regulator [Deltaproteobacteria bacterium]|jgi:DNA-binding transcriptional MerR regulator|nr:MerR family DNA-binding transcriptional regulator [Deltaproteobacteria bacterium]
MHHATLLSIKDFSDFTGINESTLRYYDKIGLLSPSHRGENRYRYYLPVQLILANFIRVLINLRVPLAVIKEMNTQRTPQEMLALLAQQENKLDRRLRDLQAAYSVIHTYRDAIQTGMFAHEHDIRVQELDEAHCVLGPPADFSDGSPFYKPFMDFCNAAPELNVNLNYPIGGYHESMTAFVNAPGQPDRFYSLDPYGKHRRNAGRHLVAYRRGYYGEFGDIAQKMLSYAQANALAFHGPVFVIYLLDEVSIANPSQYLAQIVAGVAKKR